MENILFEKMKLYSTRIGEDIELDAYTKDDLKILSSKGLISFFQTLRGDEKITVTKTVENITFDEKGDPNYCLCKCHVETADYSDDAFGESLPLTREFSDINTKYPFLTAERRAESRAIIRYLGLPNKVYSDEEIPVGVGSDDATRNDVKKTIEKMGNIKNSASESKSNEAEAPVSGLVSAPISSAASAGELQDNVEEAEKTELESVAETEDMNENNTPENQEELPETDKEAVAQERPSEPETDEAEAGAAANVSESTKAKDTQEDAQKSDPLDLIVFFGPGKGRNITVREALSDPSFKNFINVIRSGKAVVDKNDTAKAAVIEAIKNACN